MRQESQSVIRTDLSPRVLRFFAAKSHVVVSTDSTSIQFRSNWRELPSGFTPLFVDFRCQVLTITWSALTASQGLEALMKRWTSLCPVGTGQQRSLMPQLKTRFALRSMSWQTLH